MIISRGRRYIFVHIPKTGGTSMALSLEARAMKDDIMFGDTPKALKRRKKMQGAPARGRLWKHSTLRDIDGLISAKDIAQMFCFTLVRNPWDRIVSYYHWLRVQTFEHPAVEVAKNNSFDGFLKQETIQASFRSSPACSYMRDVNGDERCNAYIRIEHFQEDAGPLTTHLGFPLTLGRENTSDRNADYRQYYTPELTGIVSDICAADIVRFGYEYNG